MKQEQLTKCAMAAYDVHATSAASATVSSCQQLSHVCVSVRIGTNCWSAMSDIHIS